MGSGYVGYSMSERAAEAYADGDAPLSKWNRARLVNGICGYPGSEWTPEELECAAVSDLRKFFLYRASWHHTSKFYSRTDFYSLDEDVIEAHDFAALREACATRRDARKKEPRSTVDVAKGRIVYEQWEGSRNYGRFRRHDESCLIAAGWAYTESGKKRLDGEHVLSYEVYGRAPRGTADIYRRIAANLPKSLRSR